ncbi:MAG: hypothetical protein R2759_20340 [Bacteroidales bacterium]
MNTIFKIIATITSLVFINLQSIACEVCEKQQPKITMGLTHGSGPQNNWDWVIIGIISIITVLTLILSLKYLIRPGEKNSDHIKRFILNQ